MKVNTHTFNEKYKDFEQEEVWCPHCRVVGVTDDAMDALQALRKMVERPLTVNSAYRCPTYNKAVGGAVGSKHKLGEAFDISINGGVDKWELLEKARLVGFSGFGFYNNFLHMDLGPDRSWGKW